MEFKETAIVGLNIVDLNKIEDERGFFARAFCKEEFDNRNLDSDVLQANISFNKKSGTLRGMHYQKSPYQESKYIRCLSGSIYDVAIDLRIDSPTYLQHFGMKLSAKNRAALFIPKDFAHGFVTLEDNTEVMYLVSQKYVPGAEQGIRWDDLRFRVEWPITPKIVSEKDAQWDDFIS